MAGHRNILLYPFSLIYGLVVWIRNFLYDSEILSSEEFTIPIICVGNLTVGGTGKTPHTEYLADLLKDRFRVAILSRGYRRKTRDFIIADEKSGVSDIGDEPLQIYRKFPGVVVAVDRNRVHGVKEILRQYPETEVILLDDAFQHRKITPGFSILLSDSGRLFINDHMLPYGNLREGRINMRRADIILVTKCPADMSPIQRRITVMEINKPAYQNIYFTSLAYREPLPVFKEKEKENKSLDLSECSECGAVIVTGIANPVPLQEYLSKFFGEIKSVTFPDHHNYRHKDIYDILEAYASLKVKKKYVITTEKDAIRLQALNNIEEPERSAFYYIPIGIFFLNEDQDEFNNIIIDYVRQNKRNNRIS